MLINSELVETMQCRVMGYERSRPSLRDLVHPITSPLLDAQEQLLSLANNFDSQETSDWYLLAVMGGDFEEEEVRRFARQHILQLSVGILEVFELRMSQAPYTLGWTTFRDVGAETKLHVVENFFATPTECLSFMSSRLRALYPSPT